MAEYRLTPDAEEDLLSIASYTLETWGPDQLDNYQESLVRVFAAIANGNVLTSTPIPHRPELLSTHCRHHHIFWLREEGSPPLIIAVLHEKMDLVNRLKRRLDSST